MENIASRNIAETLLEEIPRLGQIQPICIPDKDAAGDLAGTHIGIGPLLVAVPQGLRVEDLTKQHRAVIEAFKPLQRTGKAELTDLQGFIDWSNRFKGAASAMFGTIGTEVSLETIIDYHGAGAPMLAADGDPAAAYGRHRAIYRFPVSREWALWNKISGQPLDKDTFGEFIEANAKDLLDPTPALLGNTAGEIETWEHKMIDIAAQLQGRFGQYTTLVQLSRNFQVYESGHLTVTTNRDTGEAQVQFLTEHKDPDGQPLRLPNLFMIAIPVFEEGHLYRLAVRFRYRKAGDSVKFIISLHNPEFALRDAAREAMAIAREQTSLPLMMGKPEI